MMTPGVPLPLAERLRRQPDRICSMILYSDIPRIDIEFEIAEMRRLCEDEAPGGPALFDALYVSRFDRPWAQWRAAPLEPTPWRPDFR